MHILIIWSNAVYKKDYILDDLKKHFTIFGVYKIHWDSENFLENYTTFYAHSLKRLSYSQLVSTLQKKIAHCGNDDFYLITFKDPYPQFKERETSSGNRIVNINVFDKKKEYRELTGGGHRVHSSDDAWETNKDLTLLFGLNTKDFLQKYSVPCNKDIYIKKNCEGVGGYTSIQQLFYVLNNTIEYCVLRNHECLPDEYTVKGHGDIDLLVENKNYMTYLTGAKPVFKESYRVYHTIMIDNKEIPFDFRYVGDNYYDRPWEEDILKTRVLQKNTFYTPDPIHQYYSLLYHAYIQKKEVKEDYLPKLNKYAAVLNETYNSDRQSAIDQLDSFMEKNQYEFVRPIDKTVAYNIQNVNMSNYALRYGLFLKRLNAKDSIGNKYHSCVYEKKDSYVKTGTNWLIHNEAKYLHKLSDVDGFPKVIKENYVLNNEESFIEITRVEGFVFNEFFGNVNHLRRSYIKSFILGCIDILHKLSSRNIAHRDFIPTNILIMEKDKKCKVSLIDFGWATEIENMKNNRPKGLAGKYVSINNVTDSYSLGKLLWYFWSDLPYIRVISKLLCDINYEDYHNKSILHKKLDRICVIAKFAFTPYDEWRLFCRRHRRIGLLKTLISKRLRSF